jgi:hypothetical protein
MDQQLSTSLDCLQLRLALMRDLASSLKQVQTAVVRSDVGGIDRHTARQRDLCESLGHLETPTMRLSQRWNNWERLPQDAISPEALRRWKALVQELVQVEMQVSELNLVYAALLRRAQRTLRIFMRVLESSACTYAPPKCSPALAPPTRQEASHA